MTDMLLHEQMRRDPVAHEKGFRLQTELKDKARVMRWAGGKGRMEEIRLQKDKQCAVNIAHASHCSGHNPNWSSKRSFKNA